MFNHEGPSRSPRQNAVLAAYLALVGGFVNSAGFVLIGTFTSHVTGNVGRFANGVAARDWEVAGATAAMLLAFLVGAFAASMVIETDALGGRARSYGTALLLEAALLVAFILAYLHPKADAGQAAVAGELLCGAMGVQNSLVTRLSGAVVRTTHLTGVVTDIGIEIARWFRWWRARVATKLRLQLSLGSAPAERPSANKIGLLAIIAAMFTIGAVSGAASTALVHPWAFAFPVASLVLGAGYAFVSSADVAPARGLCVPRDGKPAETGSDPRG
jgi:uncharacterized membrane protein YoaK (UPF0700 family)